MYIAGAVAASISQGKVTGWFGAASVHTGDGRIRWKTTAATLSPSINGLKISLTENFCRLKRGGVTFTGQLSLTRRLVYHTLDCLNLEGSACFMLDEERIRYASEWLPYNSHGLSISVRANANGWHVWIGLPVADRRRKSQAFIIGSSEIENVILALEDAFAKLESISESNVSAFAHKKYPVKGDISVLTFSNGSKGVAFYDCIAFRNRAELKNFVETINQAPEVGERLHALRKAEFEKVLERRATNPLPTDPEVIEKHVASLLGNRKTPRKVHNWEITEWQGNPSESAHSNPVSKRKSKSQSRKRTAIRNKEADAALLPWKILIVVIMVLFAWVSYEIND